MKPAAFLICVFVKKANYNTVTELIELVTKDYSIRRLKRVEAEDPCDNLSLSSQISIAVFCCIITLIVFSSVSRNNFTVYMEKQPQMVLTPLGSAARAKVIPAIIDSQKSSQSVELKENSDLNKVTNDQKERPQSGFRFRRGFLIKRKNSNTELFKALTDIPQNKSLLSVVSFETKAEKIMEGNVSVVYKLFKSDGEPAAIFKPYELMNDMPEDDQFKLSTKDQCINEVIAYKFDQQVDSLRRAGVPETRHVKLPSDIFSDGVSERGGYIKGSLQHYIEEGESCDDYGPSLFKTDDVQKIGVLDLRILNCDRHTGNILFNTDTKTLVPIDHALSFPQIEVQESSMDDLSATLSRDSTSELFLKNVNFDWMMFPQTKESFSEDMIQTIEKIDIDAQLETMRKAKMTVNQRMAVFASTSLLKLGAIKFNKTLHDLGSIVQRCGARNEASVFEMLVSQALDNIHVSKDELEMADEEVLKTFSLEFVSVAEDYFKL